jgi:ATP-dependent Clp protease ATP-binding subunit ClpA
MYDLLRVGKTFGREDCMFERYTEKARRVISSSIYIARRIGSPEVETEHLLLGLLSKDKGLARRFLGSPWAVEVVWRKVEQSKPIREKTQGPMELPLSNSCRHVLAFAAEEADLLSNKYVCTEHLLLGLLREEKCFAEEIVSEHGIRLASTREDLMRIPHDDSATAKFVREPGNLPEDVVELQIRIAAIVNRMENAIANHDFVKARACSDEENRERDKLYLLYKQYGLSDWIYD